MIRKRKGEEESFLQRGKPVFEEVRVPPVADLISQMAEANQHAIDELNAAEQQRKFYAGECCWYGCSCEPCRRGRCDLHGIGLRGEETRSWQDYRRLQQEWLYFGGEWNYEQNMPSFRNAEDERRWRYMARNRLESEYEDRRRNGRLADNAPPSFVFLGWDEGKDKK